MTNHEEWGAPGQGPDGYELRDLLGVFRASWPIMLAAATLSVVAAWFYFGPQIPQYSTQALVQREADPATVQQALGFRTLANQRRDLSSELRLIRSRTVLAPAVDSAGLRLVVGQPLYRRGGVIADVQVEPAAEPAGYRLEQVGTDFRLVGWVGEEVVGSAGPGGWLVGPGFRIRIAESAVLSAPLELEIASFDDALGHFSGGLTVEQIEGTNLISISYSGTDPVVAADAANALASSYARFSAESAREDKLRQRDFIAEQLADVADSLAVEQGRLQALQASAGMIDPSIDAEAIMSERLIAERETRNLLFQEEVLSSALGAIESGGDVDVAIQRVLALGASTVPGAEGLSEQLRELRAQRQGLTVSRFGYTERQPEVERLDSLIQITRGEMRGAVQQSVGVLTERRVAAEGRVAELRAEVVALPSQMAPYDRQRQKVAAVQQMLNNLTTRYYEAQMAAAVETGNVQVVDLAQVPRAPLRTRRTEGLALALVLGLSLGAGIGIVRDQLDTVLRTPEEVREASALEILATVPRARSMLRNGDHRTLPVLDASAQLEAESFRTLRTMIRFARAERPQVIAITSPYPASGKTTVSANLAAALVQEGGSVLIVDADLRRPTQHEVFQEALVPGLTDILVGRAQIPEVLREIDLSRDGVASTESGMWLLPAGSSSPSPAELLGSSRFQDLVATARERFDSVIIDTAPLLPVSDAALVGAVVDGVILVIGAEDTDRAGLAETVARLRRVDVPLLGIVINQAKKRGAFYGYGRTEYAYGTHAE